MFDTLRFKIEAAYYRKYIKMNTKRKSKDKSLKVFKVFDDVRRKIGFVK